VWLGKRTTSTARMVTVWMAMVQVLSPFAVTKLTAGCLFNVLAEVHCDTAVKSRRFL